MPWAHEAGRIAKAMEIWREEIWAEDHVAKVGLVESWDTDAILIQEPHRHGSNDGIPGKHHGGTKGLHRQALIGAARGMTNAGMDWEYVTSSELIDGLSGCYDTLVLPMHRALDEDLLSVLDEYVKHGGRIVVDCQFDFCDAHGRVSLHGEDTVAGKLFGAWTETVHDGRTGGPIWEGQPVEGFWADLEINDAEVVARFSDGRAAVTRKAHGEGEAILMALDPASAALTPKNAWAETLLTSLAQTTPNAWSSTLPLTLCRTTPDADHFFLINPGPATTAYLHQDGVNEWLDVLEGAPLKGIQGGCAVPIEAGSACWVRANTSR